MTIESTLTAFAALHQPGNPLVLVNAWDAGSARAIAEAGASAVATSSWAVAAAAGYEDGEALPLEKLIETAGSVARAVSLPVTVDFEGGYATAPEEVAANARLLLEQGIVGCNFEDRVVGGEGLYGVAEQAERVRAIGAAAASLGRGVLINARTDLFFEASPAEHSGVVDAALERAHAYREAGAGSFFVPGLADPALIERLCGASPLPVNIMVLDLGTDLAALARLGVARISFGPAPYIAAMKSVTEAAAGVYGR